jgi:peptide chain release factor subunit 1
MICRADIDMLLERKPAADSPVLSVYLDIDQRKQANLNRGFEAALGDMLRSVAAGLQDKQDKRRESFAADAARARDWVSSLEPKGKGAIVFADDSEDFFWALEIMAPVSGHARWSETPYLLPLLKVFDEYERYGVVLTDRERARLFTVFIGAIEEHHEALAPAAVSRPKTTGTDHMLSENRFQSKADMHAHWHLKRVAALVDKFVDGYGYDRLLLAGPVEATSELYHLLSKRSRNRVVRKIALPVTSNLRDVLEETLQIEREVERQAENRIVDELLDGNPPHIVAHGLEKTLRALAEKRVWRMVYGDGFGRPGGRCANCGMLFARASGACDYCGGAVQPVDDLLERMAERVIESDGHVEEVESEAAARLQKIGGVGAFLRF